MNTLLLALVAGAGFSVASLLGLTRAGAGERLRSISVSVAAGILLAIAIAELLPEALESAGHERAVFGFLLGFVALFLVEVLTRGHTHHDPAEHLYSHTLWPFIFGLALHNLTDGFAIGTSSELSEEAGGAVTLGVLIHQIPVGISLAAVLIAASVGRQFFTRAALGLGLCIPAGAAVVTALPVLTDEELGTMIAAAAGALVYIGAGHLLPEAHSEGRPSPTTLLAFPMVLLATAYLFVFVLHHE